MCGITGVFAFNEKGKASFEHISVALENMNKRGPDHKGTFFHENVALGHARLSIIDTSESAHQPFISENGHFIVVFNGEIFNFRELKELPVLKNSNFHTQSDTEVLLHLFIELGSEMLNLLNGFFAIAIYDKTEKSLFLARDRYGIKPLLYFKDADKLVFASEMKSLIAYDIPNSIDNVSLYQYLQLNYIPPNGAIFNGVKKLEAGTFLKISDVKVEQNRFYEIPYHNETSINRNISYNDAQKKLYELLEYSVSKRLIADVPLGAFLSGGLDSSVIVALASKQTANLNTFSIGFKDEPFFDETIYAETVAEKFKTNHTTFKLSNDDLFANLFETLDYIDEPFADSSALAVNILSMHTKKHVTVALSGDGADEIFGGYNKHRAELRIRNANFNEKIIENGSFLWNLLPKSRNSSFSNKIRQFDKFAKGMKLNIKDRYWLWCSISSEEQVSRLLQTPFDMEEYLERKNAYLNSIRNEGSINDVLFADTKMVLQGDMLTKVDSMSMAHSLEVRTPFLDYNVVDFAFSLPWEFKLDKNIGKKILQDTFRNDLPEIIYHRSKHGFEVPLLKWFKTELKSIIINELLEKTFVKKQNIFSPIEVDKLLMQLFSNNPGDSVARVWGLIVFQYWWKKNGQRN